MTVYRITNTRSGLDLGIYHADTPDGALEALARDAGYRTYEDMCDVAPGADLEVVELEDEPEQLAECVYCGRDAELVPVPAVDDDDAWEALAADHAPGCEWIRTRAHRREAR
jgi:hypothetical protein